MKTKLNDLLIKKLSKTFEPDSLLKMKFKGYDVAYKTDEEAMLCRFSSEKKLKLVQLKGKDTAEH